MKTFLTLTFLMVSFSFSFSQNYQSLDTIKPYGEYKNLYVRILNSDSLVSSFVIFIKKEVKAHKHLTHSEHVHILEGEGEMMLAEKKFPVKN